MSYEEKYKELRNHILASAKVDLEVDLTGFQCSDVHSGVVRKIYKEILLKIKELEQN